MTDAERQLALARCDRELADAERELRAGNPDVEGLLRASVDWAEERRIIEEGKC